MIGAPGHGKYVAVDTPNAITKKYMKQKIRMVTNPGSKKCCHQKMKVHSVSETETTSFALECLRLCTLEEERKDGVKSSSKYAKPSARVSEQLYYL